MRRVLSKKISILLNERVLSILAIVVAVSTLCWQVGQDIQESKEELFIYSYQPDPNYKFKITRENKNIIVPMQFKILLANTGDPPVTIFNFNEEMVEASTSKKSGTNTLSDVGFTSEDDKSIKLPIILKSGEGIVLKYIIRFSLMQTALDAVNKTYFQEKGNDIFDKEITYYDLIYYSVKAGKDIFGNSFIGSATRDEVGFPESAFKMGGKNISQPKVKVIFTSARRHSFEHILKIYPEK